MSRVRWAKPAEKARVLRWLDDVAAGRVSGSPPADIQRIITIEARRKDARRKSAIRSRRRAQEAFAQELSRVFGGTEVQVNNDGTYTMKHPYARLRMRERQ